MKPKISVMENGSVHIGNNQWVSLEAIQEAVYAVVGRPGARKATANYGQMQTLGYQQSEIPVLETPTPPRFCQSGNTHTVVGNERSQSSGAIPVLNTPTPY